MIKKKSNTKECMKTIMTAHVFRKILAITDPASNILHVIANRSVDCAKISRDGRGAVTSNAK